MIRSFIAIEINEKTREKIGKLIIKLCKTEADVKWVEPENLHVTLKFLGYIKEEDIADISKAVKETVQDIFPFSLSIEGLGAFPDLKRPNVVFVNIKEKGKNLVTLHTRLNERMASFGITRETRKYDPHLTIGRVRSRKNINLLTYEIESNNGAFFGQELVESIALMMSELYPEGPRYSRLDTVTLIREGENSGI